MHIAVRVQHHPSRAALLPPLLERLDDFNDVAVVPDPAPLEKPDAWRTHRACLEAMQDSHTHLLVLQDDVVIHDHSLMQKLNNAIDRHPESVLLAFVPGFPRERRNMMLAQRTGQTCVSFIVGAFVPTVAIIYPRAVVEGLLAWAHKSGDRYRRPFRGADDGIVAHYCRTRRIHPLAMVPCAVEHDDTLPSVGRAPRTGPHRRAALI